MSDIDPRLAKTNYIIEATRFEQLTLWQNYKDKYSWESDNSGRFYTVGHYNKHPICISLFWATINNKLIMFLEPTSKLVHWDIIEKWLDKNCNPMDGSRKARTDSMNFHNAIH